MKYTKPVIIAQSKKSGSYAAGCPSQYMGSEYECKRCDRAR